MGELTANDRRVLRGVESVCAEYDGFAPHGPADWTAIRRLERYGLVRLDGYAECQTCPDPHDVPGYVLTDAGREFLEARGDG